MNLEQLINENISKKWGIAIIGVISLAKVGAPSWQIMVVILTAIGAQMFLDYEKKKV